MGKYTPQITIAVERLGAHASLSNLKQMGFSKREVEQAVRDGAIRWLPDGRLERA